MKCQILLIIGVIFMEIIKMIEILNPDMFWINLDNEIRNNGLYKGVENINNVRKEAANIIFERFYFDKEQNVRSWTGYHMVLHIIHPESSNEFLERIKEIKLKNNPSCDIEYEMHYLMYCSLSLICTLLTKIEIMNRKSKLII